MGHPHSSVALLSALAAATLGLACNPERSDVGSQAVSRSAEAPPQAEGARVDTNAAAPGPVVDAAAERTPTPPAESPATTGTPPQSETTSETAGQPLSTPVRTAAASPAPSPPAETPAAPTPAHSTAYPTDAPYYPGARIIETGLGRDGRVKQVSSSPDSGEQVYAHMTKSLEAQGWQIQSKLAQDGQFALDAKKADRRTAVLIADRDIIEPPDGATRVTVLVTP